MKNLSKLYKIVRLAFWKYRPFFLKLSMKILILKFRNIGDVLLVTPLLSNLKRHYPDAQIDMAVSKGTEAMISQNPNIANVITHDRKLIKSLGFFKRLWEEIKFSNNLRKRHYDIVINLTDGDRGAQIALFTQATVRIGYRSKNLLFKKAFTHYLDKQNYIHSIDANLAALELLKIPVTDKRVEIFWSHEDQQVVEKLLSPYNDNVVMPFVHIHPVSRWLFKCIADETMAKIIDYCENELKIKVVLTTAPEQKEIDKVNAILALCNSKPINLSGQLTLKQTAALNKLAKLFIGVDTAIMHMSAANDTPVIAFFGPTGINNWGPWDNSMTESTYLKRNGCQQMGRHRVIAESRLCQPCGRDGCNGTKISDCLMALDWNLIENAIQEVIVEQND